MTHFAYMVLAALLSTLPGIGVRGNASCPTPAAVEAALVGLIAPAGAQREPGAVEDVVDILDQGGAATVRLSSARGEAIGEKRLPDRLSCGERAQAAAVVVAAWEARLRGVVAEVRVPTQPPPVAVPPPARPPDRARAPIQGETSAALFASVTANGVAPGGRSSWRWRGRIRRFHSRSGAVIVGDHSLGVATGRGVWRRFPTSPSSGVIPRGAPCACS